MCKRNIMVLVLALVLVLGLTACSSKTEQQEEPEVIIQQVHVTGTPTPAQEEAPKPAQQLVLVTPAPVLEEGPASIDFEDGLFGFTAITQPTITSDNSTLTIEERNGSKVLFVKNTYGKKESYVGFDLSALLGDKIADVETIKFDAGVEGGEVFAAISGDVETFTGEEAITKTKIADWSIYLANKNPKTITAKVKTPFVAGQNNYIIIAKNDDVTEKQSMWLDNIKFLDKDGNLIAANTAAVVAANSPLNATDETPFVYGKSTPLNLTYQGDWSTGAGIPAGFFENAQGPVNVVADVLVINPGDWAGFFATDANWAKPVATDFVGLDNAGNGIIHFQDDGAIIFDDLGATRVSFTITKEKADFYAANGGMFFPGYNVQILSATVSDTSYQVVNNVTYQGDWSTGVGIPAEIFADATAPISVTLETIVLNPGDWAGFFAADANWTKPTAETFVDIDNAGNGIIHFQDDGALIFDDLGATEVTFTITPEAAAAYAANGGMFFPGYNVQVVSAFVSKNIYRSVNNLTYQGDWSTGVGIPAAFFANVTKPVNVILNTLVINPGDWAGFFATDANWAKPTAETFVDIDNAGNGVIHFQDDGALIFDDLGATVVTFTITPEAAANYAANGGMFFPGYNVQILSAIVSEERECCFNNLTYQGDWSTGAGVPAGFFEGAEGNVNVTLNVLVINPGDWAGFFATDANWTKPTAETFVGLDETGNGVIHFQSDGAIIFDDLGATQITFTITKEAADFYAANGGMFFPGYNAQILSAIVSK